MKDSPRIESRTLPPPNKTLSNYVVHLTHGRTLRGGMLGGKMTRETANRVIDLIELMVDGEWTTDRREELVGLLVGQRSIPAPPPAPPNETTTRGAGPESFKSFS